MYLKEKRGKLNSVCVFFLFNKISDCLSFTHIFPPHVAFCLVNDTLDEIFDESGDEEESQDIVNQVLDEIGIEISGKVRYRHWY